MTSTTACAYHRPSPWTPQREARALRLYLEEGFSAAEVADALGPDISRCAVIGKIRRLGHLKRGSPRAKPRRVAPAAAPRRPRVERRLPPQRPPKPLPPLREPGAMGEPVTLAALGAGLCRWPIDDPGPGRMHLALFCGGWSDDHRYCAAHRLINRRTAAAP